jgi:hypothetical protein
MQIRTILDQIKEGAIALPEFQRGYVWNRDQVRRLMTSLYRRHPVGSLLVWVTKTDTVDARGDHPLPAGNVKLILDGQQRITSLFGIIKGSPPPFFAGNAQTFTGLYFHLRDEAFEFHAPIKMKNDPLWINVTELMQDDQGATMGRLFKVEEIQPDFPTYLNRLAKVQGIQAIDLHSEEVAGDHMTVDVVVEIFNNVNSGGTKLTKGDLALAKICAKWPQARDEMNERLQKWQAAGFSFRLEWLLRCINTILTGEALFSALKDTDTLTFRKGLQDAEKAVDTLLNVISSRLGLDYDLVLGSRYSFPLLARYLAERDWKLSDQSEWNKLLFWYIQTFLWGRYAGSTETVLNQDLALIENPDGALDRLIAQIGQQTRLNLTPDDFAGWSRSARFFPLLYMLTRVSGARDWETGVELSKHLLGKSNSLQLHHIFPKALLYKNGYSRAEVNALANFTFLTQETNLRVSDRDPAVYLLEYSKMHPGALESHWIPTDKFLWRVENYREFLAARRQLLADTANAFLDSLLQGTASARSVGQPILEREFRVTPGVVATEGEQRMLDACQEWVTEQGLPSGEFMYELTDPATGQVVANLDLAWPNGLQEGYSEPVALLLDEEQETEEATNRAGFRYFTDVRSFRTYVQRDILAMDDEVA